MNFCTHCMSMGLTVFFVERGTHHCSVLERNIHPLARPGTLVNLNRLGVAHCASKRMDAFEVMKSGEVES